MLTSAAAETLQKFGVEKSHAGIQKESVTKQPSGAQLP